MDQQRSQVRGRSHSAASAGGAPVPHPSHIRNDHSPETVGNTLGTASSFGTSQTDFSTYDTNTAAFVNNNQQSFGQSALNDPSLSSFNTNQEPFAQQLADDNASFGAPAQGGYGGPNLGDADFIIYPPTSGEEFDNTPLFNDCLPLGGQGSNMMRQGHNHPTPPHLLKPDPISVNHSSPNFNNQQQFCSSPRRHSRNGSLAPEAALLAGQIDWNQGQFQSHRRSPSEYSDVSSVGHSPNLLSADSFDQMDHSHSPMQRPQDHSIYQELHGIGTFSLGDQGTHSPHTRRSPSHSPAMSPRVPPQQPISNMNQSSSYILQPPQGGAYMQSSEAFPQFQPNGPDMSSGMPAPPAINIDFAPTAMKSGFEQPKSLDADSLVVPPGQRGRPRQRQRAVTDPNNGGPMLGTRPASNGLSNSLSPANAETRNDPARSLSPFDRNTPAGRRRQSTSAVPNNVIALRLADPNYEAGAGQGENGQGGSKRVQKHPATFQCTLCPKRFTRAYNLRSHLRTHTDERPFVCTVCGKAFARQHDRKRHEGLHSGEKKFVCRGDLKAGSQWGCGRRFARADALGRHFRSEAGRVCIKPLLDEEMLERQRVWNEQRMQQAAAQGMMGSLPGGPGMMMPGMDPNAPPPPGFPMDTGGFGLPAALLAQYPALAQMNWSAPEMGGNGIDDEMSGRSSFDASDYEEGEEAGYVSGPGTGFGQGGMQEGFGEIGYASDYGGR